LILNLRILYNSLRGDVLMSESICRFLSSQEDQGSIKAIRFVYETEFPRMRQPFISSIFYLHVVTDGCGILYDGRSSYPLEPGSIYFSFPARPYEIRDAHAFRYIYISFMGPGAAPLMEKLHISPDKPVYQGYDWLCPIFASAIRNARTSNASTLALGLLLYTMGLLAASDAGNSHKPQQLFTSVVDYVDTHFNDPSLSLKVLAAEFSYTGKYLSSLFVKHMKIPFHTYLLNLRIQQAMILLQDPGCSIAQVAEMCGFANPLYFSKVFKKRTGWTPTEYIQTVCQCLQNVF